MTSKPSPPFPASSRASVTRRSGLKLLSAVGAGIAMAGWPGSSLRAQTSQTELHAALRQHLRYSAGFRRKLATGFYSEIGAQPTMAEAARAYGGILDRLAALEGANLALVHHVAEDGHLHGWLIDGTGVVASSRSSEPYRGIGYLTWALNVDQRMQTRVAIPRNAPAKPAAEPPARADLTVEEALALAADELLGAQIGTALEQRRGRLLVLPARDTGGAPFAALPLPSGEMLTRRHAIVVMSDVEALGSPDRIFDTREIRWRSPLLVGNPDLAWNREFQFSPLPHAQAEVETIRQLIGLDPDRVLTGSEATLDRVVRSTSTYGSADLVYLASHAVTNRVNPMDGSFVGLAGGNLTGQLLRGDTFEAWGARHPLVVLSACQTALGRIFDGGAYGMSRVMHAAGAAQVVSSLWSVDDEATRVLMTEFADKLYLGYSTEVALQRAQWKAAALYDGDPGAWASFCVFGMPSTSSLGD